MIAATLYGVLVISAIQGTLGTFIFWALGLPSPLLWGVVMFFLSMIPMAGSFLVWVPAAIFLALTGAYIKAGVLVGLGHAGDRHRSTTSSRRGWSGSARRLHELLIFFSVLGGLQVFGVLGLVLGPGGRGDHAGADRDGSGGAHADGKTLTGGGEEGGLLDDVRDLLPFPVRISRDLVSPEAEQLAVLRSDDEPARRDGR